MNVFSGKCPFPHVFFLLTCSVIIIIFGAASIPALNQGVSLYEGGLSGLLLVTFGLWLQVAGLFLGSRKRSWLDQGTGSIVSVTGFASCFIPGFLGLFPLVLVMALLGISGVSWWLSATGEGRNRAHECRVIGSHCLPIAAAGLLQILIAGLLAARIFRQDLFYGYLPVSVLLSLGIALFCSAVIIWKHTPDFPECSTSPAGNGGSLDLVTGMQYGYYLVVLGCLLVPVNLGLLPYALGAIYGSLVVLFGLQVMIAGRLTSFQFGRTPASLLTGMILIMAGSGAVMVNTPVEALKVLIGVILIAGGLYLLYILLSGSRSGKRENKPEGRDILLMISLGGLVLLTAIFMILFGASLLIENLISGMILAVFIIFYGISQFLLQYILCLAEQKNLIRA
jgi:hypothetical protein